MCIFAVDIAIKDKQTDDIIITEDDQKQMFMESRKKCAGFFFTLAQLVFTAFVIGGLALFFTDFKFSWRILVMLVFGLLSVYALYKSGMLFFKLKKNEKEETL